MLPPLYKPPPIYRPRPINPFDNASTTGLFSNPNGTYIANPFPTTGAIGGTGAYGAMLPQVRAGPFPSLPNQFGGVGGVPYGPQQETQFQYGNALAQATGAAAPFGYGPVWQNKRLAQGTPQILPNYKDSERGAPAVKYSGFERGSYSQSEYGTAGVTNPSVLNSMARRIAANPAEYENLSPAQKEAIDRLIQVRSGQGGPGGTPGAGQFYGYERNKETGRSERVVKSSSDSDFSKELRWDPDRGKYVQIGKLMKEGKLDKYGGWHKKKKGGGGGRRSPEVKRTSSGWTGSYGVISFNTGTG